MRVEEFKASDMLCGKLLSDSTETVRRSAVKAVQAARSEIHKSEILVEKSREVLERVERDMKELRNKKEQRTTKKAASEQRSTKRI
jgi:hypothetical protein